MTATAGAVILDRAQCVELLAGDDIGRLAVVVGGAPHIFPVNYVLDGECIVFRTDPGTKLHAAARAPACFEIDRFDHERRTGWSVVAHGQLHELMAYDGSTFKRLAAMDVTPWAAGEKAHWMRLIPSYFTGRRLERPPCNTTEPPIRRRG